MSVIDPAAALHPAGGNGTAASAAGALDVSGRVEQVTEVTVFPTGAKFDTDTERSESLDWSVRVVWRGWRGETGRGGYAVTGRAALFLSRAGNWAFHVEPFQQHQYRWATLAEALEAARAAVDTLRCNGMTYADFQGWLASRDTSPSAQVTSSDGGPLPDAADPSIR